MFVTKMTIIYNAINYVYRMFPDLFTTITVVKSIHYVLRITIFSFYFPQSRRSDQYDRSISP